MFGFNFNKIKNLILIHKEVFSNLWFSLINLVLKILGVVKTNICVLKEIIFFLLHTTIPVLLYYFLALVYFILTFIFNRSFNYKFIFNDFLNKIEKPKKFNFYKISLFQYIGIILFFELIIKIFPNNIAYLNKKVYAHIYVIRQKYTFIPNNTIRLSQVYLSYWRVLLEKNGLKNFLFNKSNYIDFNTLKKFNYFLKKLNNMDIILSSNFFEKLNFSKNTIIKLFLINDLMRFNLFHLDTFFFIFCNRSAKSTEITFKKINSVEYIDFLTNNLNLFSFFLKIYTSHIILKDACYKNKFIPACSLKTKLKSLVDSFWAQFKTKFKKTQKKYFELYKDEFFFKTIRKNFYTPFVSKISYKNIITNPSFKKFIKIYWPVRLDSDSIEKYSDETIFTKTNFFLRKTKIFNKSRYSRNRQLYRTGVYMCLYINVIFVYFYIFSFYRLSFAFGYLWLGLVIFVLVPIFSRTLKYRLYNPLYFLNELENFWLWFVTFFDILDKKIKHFLLEDLVEFALDVVSIIQLVLNPYFNLKKFFKSLSKKRYRKFIISWTTFLEIIRKIITLIIKMFLSNPHKLRVPFENEIIEPLYTTTTLLKSKKVLKAITKLEKSNKRILTCRELHRILISLYK